VYYAINADEEDASRYS